MEMTEMNFKIKNYRIPGLVTKHDDPQEALNESDLDLGMWDYEDTLNFFDNPSWRLEASEMHFPLTNRDRLEIISIVEYGYLNRSFDWHNDDIDENVLEYLRYDKKFDAQGNPIAEPITDTEFYYIDDDRASGVPDADYPYNPRPNPMFKEIILHPDKYQYEYEMIFKAFRYEIENRKHTVNEMMPPVPFKDSNWVLEGYKAMELLNLASGDIYEKATGKKILPDSILENLIFNIQSMHSEYDPYDFKHEALGYGQTNQEAFNEDETLNFRSTNPLPLFSELHGLQNVIGVSYEFKEFIQGFIDVLRYFYIDPFTDSVSCMRAEPGRKAQSIRALTTWYASVVDKGVDSIEWDFYEVRNQYRDDYDPQLIQLSEYEIVDGVETADFALFSGTAQKNGKEKCRTIHSFDGKINVIAYGNVYFAKMDRKGNVMNKYSNGYAKYGNAEKFIFSPISDERCYELLCELTDILLRTEDGPRILSNGSFTVREMKDYMNYHGIKYDQNFRKKKKPNYDNLP